MNRCDVLVTVARWLSQRPRGHMVSPSVSDIVCVRSRVAEVNERREGRKHMASWLISPSYCDEERCNLL